MVKINPYITKLDVKLCLHMLFIPTVRRCYCRSPLTSSSQSFYGIINSTIPAPLQSQIQALFKHFEGVFPRFSSTLKLWQITYFYVYVLCIQYADYFNSCYFPIHKLNYFSVTACYRRLTNWKKTQQSFMFQNVFVSRLPVYIVCERQKQVEYF